VIPSSSGSFGGGATCNCAGSECNQNNFGRKKREILAETQEEEEDNKVDTEATAESIEEINKCEAQFFSGFGGATINCAGSQCNHNSFGKKKRR
jgi:hypothetical protein